ncbi:alpha/beta hydrolase [Pollutimonas sp. H1-120]|uniref:alpha/beta fold hydrolase n=1 Tax=Pollutimonas sp. H1-120 TaxID=3148824 RepID=UPI003B5171AE
MLFLHGWPEDWSAWMRVMELAGEHVHAFAVDLPGIGESVMNNPPATTGDIAHMLNGVVAALELKRFAIVGHDIGGQVAYAYLCQHANTLEAAAIMDVAIPGIPPWEEVLRNPAIWHFAFHALPELPELLVSGKELAYFDFFYEALARHPERISLQARAAYAAAYARPHALGAGFNWYRAFAKDAADNKAEAKGATPIDTPLLYIRGQHEAGDIGQYLADLRGGGIQTVRGAIIDDCGHFAPEEQPADVWNTLLGFFQEHGMIGRRP